LMSRATFFMACKAASTSLKSLCTTETKLLPAGELREPRSLYPHVELSLSGLGVCPFAVASLAKYTVLVFSISASAEQSLIPQ
jgi:hypothetical protein